MSLIVRHRPKAAMSTAAVSAEINIQKPADVVDAVHATLDHSWPTTASELQRTISSIELKTGVGII